MVDGTGYEIKSGKTLVNGTAYEVGFGGFELFFDFGSITPNKTTFGGVYYEGEQVDLTFDFDKVTHLIINGEIYECELKENGSYDKRFVLVGGDAWTLTEQYPFRVRFYKYSSSDALWTPQFHSFEAGTYTVSVGAQN